MHLKTQYRKGFDSRCHSHHTYILRSITTLSFLQTTKNVIDYLSTTSLLLHCSALTSDFQQNSLLHTLIPYRPFLTWYSQHLEITENITAVTANFVQAVPTDHYDQLSSSLPPHPQHAIHIDNYKHMYVAVDLDMLRNFLGKLPLYKMSTTYAVTGCYKSGFPLKQMQLFFICFSYPGTFTNL